MVDVILGIGILALAFCVFCQVKINREIMRVIDAHIDGPPGMSVECRRVLP